MKKRVGYSALTVLMVGGVGFVLGMAATGHTPQMAFAFAQQAQPQATEDGKLRVIVFGAHPDDAEYRGAGVAMKWAKAGASRETGVGHQRRYRPLANGGRCRWRAAQEAR